MLEAPKPKDEEKRVQALRDLQILDTPINPIFERITRITKRMFNVPIVAISIIDSERQWFKSTQGLNVCENDLKTSFCSHAILQQDLFVVEDATKDTRFADNPMVAEDPKIRFYAGCPVQTSDGHNIGTLCIIDKQVRQFSEDELQGLRDMASLVQDELQKYREKYSQLQIIAELDQAKRAKLIDGLTGVWNRQGIEINIQQYLKLAKEETFNIAIGICDIDDFKKVNDTYGHNAGDEVLREVCKQMVLNLDEYNVIGRWGGEEFILMAKYTDNKQEVLQQIDNMREVIAGNTIYFETTPIRVTITVGITTITPLSEQTLSAIIARADAALYEGKRSGKNKLIEN